VALGLLVAVLLITRQSGRVPSKSLTLLAESEGAIRAVAFQYTRETAPFTLPPIKAFLAQVESETEVVAVCGNEDDAAAARRAYAECKLRTVVVGKPITGWCKDRFLVARGEPAPLAYPKPSESGLATRTNDSLVAPALAAAYPKQFRTAQIPMDFDAGDILATGSHVIFSDSLWRKNGCPRGFRGTIERLFRGKTVWLRGVPDHHIGMYAAPLDGRVAVVGDLEMGRRLWTKRMEARFGKPDFSRETVRGFASAAEQLRKAGYRLIRAPEIVLAPKVYITYTNGVFETRGSRRIVHMPLYGDATLDAAGRRAYESAGWEVRPIPVETVYRFRGTIGCLINVMERDP